MSAHVRERVLASAEALGYETNELARSMTTGITMTVGVVFADIGNPFFAGVLRGLSDRLRKAGYGTLLVSTDEDSSREEEAVRLLLAKQVDGLIITPTGGRSAAATALCVAAQRIPVVQVDRTVDQVDSDAVVMDNRDAAREATSVLLQAGHRRVALAWGPELRGSRPTAASLIDAAERTELTSVGERFLGFADAFARSNLEFDPSLVMARDQTVAGVRSFVRALLKDRATRPSALLATEHDAVTAAIAEIRGADLRIPQDVSIIAFDDSPWAEVIDPAITTVRQPVRELGFVAAERLLARMGGDDQAPFVTHIASTLVRRGSVDAPAR